MSRAHSSPRLDCDRDFAALDPIRAQGYCDVCLMPCCQAMLRRTLGLRICPHCPYPPAAAKEHWFYAILFHDCP